MDVPSERLFFPLTPHWSYLIFALVSIRNELRGSVACAPGSLIEADWSQGALQPGNIPLFLCGVINKDTSSLPECRHFRCMEALYSLVCICFFEQVNSPGQHLNVQFVPHRKNPASARRCGAMRSRFILWLQCPGSGGQSSAHVGFVVDTVALGGGFLRVGPPNSVFRCQYHSTNAPYLFSHQPPTLQYNLQAVRGRYT
jgi:hypothetical protein